MKRIVFLLLAFFLIFSGFSVIHAQAKEATCPDSDGWTKIDSDDLSLYPVDGATDYCFKAGSENSNGCIGGIFGSIPEGGFGNNGYCGLSHWSYFIGEGDPTVTPTLPGDTPTATSTQPGDTPTATSTQPGDTPTATSTQPVDSTLTPPVVQTTTSEPGPNCQETWDNYNQVTANGNDASRWWNRIVNQGWENGCKTKFFETGVGNFLAWAALIVGIIIGLVALFGGRNRRYA